MRLETASPIAFSLKWLLRMPFGRPVVPEV
jgi:hypothetical protein